MRASTLTSAAKDTFNRVFEDRLFQLAAALSFYAMLSLAPLLVVIIAISSLIWGEQAAQGQLVDQVSEFVGPNIGRTIEGMLANASGLGAGSSTLSIVFGVLTTLVAATTVFAQLQNALNQVWGVEAKPQSAVTGYLWTRLQALGLVLVICLLVLLVFVASATLSLMQQRLPGPGWMWQVINVVVTAGIFSLLVAVIFRYLPDVDIPWKTVWFGAILTAILFAIGNFLIGLYLGTVSVGSAYGAAGSLVVLLVWIYYSAIIFFLGAEITEVYSRLRGTPIKPSEHAVAFERKHLSYEETREREAHATGEKTETETEPPRDTEAQEPGPASPDEERRQEDELERGGHA
ncbi:MAG: YihY/virulence factor BrkB family protein [Phycisphaeraceae bacterium]